MSTSFKFPDSPSRHHLPAETGFREAQAALPPIASPPAPRLRGGRLAAYSSIHLSRPLSNQNRKLNFSVKVC